MLHVCSSVFFATQRFVTPPGATFPRPLRGAGRRQRLPGKLLRRKTPESKPKKGGKWVWRRGLAVHGFTIQSSTEALGVDSRFRQPDAQVLASSGKSTTFRGTIHDRDLVWRQMDVDGLPRHTEWTTDALKEAAERELEAYAHLGAEWGRLVLELVFFGPDVNSLWVTTTTYEGVSLRELKHRSGGRPDAAVKHAALEALRALHTCGVVHGDADLRNAVWRDNGGAVLWVDLERATVRGGPPRRGGAPAV